MRRGDFVGLPPRIINPDGLKNQIDGSTIQTISRTLIEEVKFDRSAVTASIGRLIRS